jgi:CRP/FNR family transcriptional regulator
MGQKVITKLETFFKQFTRKTYKRGELLIHAEEAPAGVFYLKRGIVREYAISTKGDEVTVNAFKPLSFFPMSWAINSTPNEFYFDAVTNVVVFLAPKERTIDFVLENPDVAYDLLGRVYKGTDGLLMRMRYLMAETAYARLVTELIILSKRFGNHAISPQIVILEKELASQTGMTRETVSRTMRTLKQKGLITFDSGVITIADLPTLEKELLVK